MPSRRLIMRKCREILRLKLERSLSHRKIGKNLNISPGSVGSVVRRAKNEGLLDWTLVKDLTAQ